LLAFGKSSVDLFAGSTGSLFRVGVDFERLLGIDENPTAFLTLVGKILPLQVSATVKHDLSELTDAELIAIASAGHDGTVGEADSAQAKGEQPSLH
jgi:hypothetical protein